MIEIDNKIKIAFENCKALHKRCTIFLTGSKATENVSVVISMRDYDINYNPKILWCFKRDNHFIKRGGKINRKFEKSCKKLKVDNDNFENFAFSHDINWCHYNDTDNILGQTFDVCVLQDFDSLTPNKLAKTIETVQGGGLIIFILSEVNKITDFGALEMDAHKKYKTFAYDKVNFRFNYRFFYSIMNFNDCFLLNNDLQLIPINSNFISSVNEIETGNEEKRVKKLTKWKKTLTDGLNENVINAIDLCVTKDQTNALVSLFRMIDSNNNVKLVNETSNSEKLEMRKKIFDHEPYIAMITSSRGRGKSSLLGIAISIAIDRGLSRICVTSPHLTNVCTLMQFVVKGLIKMGYKENRDFIKRTKCVDNTSEIVEIEVVKNSQRQIVKYMSPTDSNIGDKFDLLCIDETAAIPLPLVRCLLAIKCDMVFMASTVHGYEGTGRSLSLKLMKQIRDKFQTDNSVKSDRFLEITLKEPVRYSRNDNVEKWLYDLLCLDCGSDSNEFDKIIENHQPSINDCQLFIVNRDVLFCGSANSERFLQQIMSIYVSSHYKNTPNDLQMLADCSSHKLFCLAKPVLMDNGLPIVCAIIQVAMEGGIDPIVARTSLEKGNRPSGDMIPWTIVQQFNQYEFAKLSGARIVRIAVPHILQRQGYGARALKLFYEYFDKENVNNKNAETDKKSINELINENEKWNDLQTVTGLPPLESLGCLLIKVSDIVPERLDYIGVSYGLTSDLLRFWKKNDFIPLYLRQTMNDTTGEHSCIMIRPLSHSDKVDGQSDWAHTFHNDFCRRFCNLLPGPFKAINSIVSLEILHQKSKSSKLSSTLTENTWDLTMFLSKNDLGRLEKYVKGIVDYHCVMDLVHVCALIFHTKRFKNLKLPKFQQLVLLGLGLQYKTVEELVLDFAALENLGSKTSGSEILGHLKECLKVIVKSMKSL